MRGAVAARRRVDYDIPAPPLRVCSHIRGADAGGSVISWGQRWFAARGFEADAENWVLDPFVAPAPPPLRDRVCVNACNDLCWSQFSTRLRPRQLRSCVNVPLRQYQVNFTGLVSIINATVYKKEQFFSRAWQIDKPISPITQYIKQISHNTPFCDRNVRTCAHFCYTMVHGTDVLLDLCNGCMLFRLCHVWHSHQLPYGGVPLIYRVDFDRPVSLK